MSELLPNTSAIENVPVGVLQRAAYNPRVMPKDEMERLVRSMGEFGFVQPAVARVEDMLLIGGHQRIAAWCEVLKRRGMDDKAIQDSTVPVVMLTGVSDERAKILNLALNKIQGEWDYGKLGELLQGLKGVDLDLTLSGFKMPEIEDLIPLGLELGMGDPGSLKEPGEAGGDAPGTPEAGANDPRTASGGADVDAALEARERRILFEMPTKELTQEVLAVLEAFGRKGADTAAVALIAVCRTAMAKKDDAAVSVVDVPPAAKKKKNAVNAGS